MVESEPEFKQTKRQFVDSSTYLPDLVMSKEQVVKEPEYERVSFN